MVSRLGYVACVTIAALSIAAADERGRIRLVSKLSGRSEAVRMQTLAELETQRAQARQALPSLAAAAAKLGKEAAPDDLVGPSVVRLLRLIGSFDDPLAEGVLVELLDAEHLGIAMVAAETLGENKFHSAIDFLKKQTGRADYSVNYAFRFNLMRALMLMQHSDAVEFVSEQSDQLDGQLKFKIEQSLDEVTVEHFGGDRQRFDQWTEQRRKRRLFSEDGRSAGHLPESLQRIEFGQPSYYGIAIRAQRLLFILDHSGSMKAYDGGQTRLDRAKAELIRAIEALPADTEFGILVYETKVNPWRAGLVTATSENKQRAVQYVRRLDYGDKTNTYDALRLALEFDDELESVFLLSDGEPTFGKLVAKPAILNDILHRNRFRHLTINTVGIAVENQTEDFLKQLAEATDGEYRSAN